MEECIVSSVYPERNTVRVKRTQLDGTISAELPILNQWTLKNQAYTMPKVDEHVVCIFKGSVGYVIGAIYSEVTEPPVKDENKHYIRFEDGTFVEYDTSTHEMRIECVGSIFMTAKEDIFLEGREIHFNKGESGGG